ncbi:MAG: exopolyphosphatase [Lysobacteraceae bacterium]
MSPSGARTPLEEGELLAAIDIGSNSFHMVVARHVLGQLRIVDRLREMVRMAAGLDGRGGLDPAAMLRALDCLSRFGQRLDGVPPQRVRAIATNTVRALRNPRTFLLPAETALGHAIEVVAGREEARLIYLGVAQGLPPKSRRRLVIDIGGGSTEFIIGHGFEPLERESVQVGCVATTRRFFGGGRISRKRWREAATEVAAELQQFAAAYRARGWQEVIGSSGTIKAIGAMHRELKLSRGVITREGIGQLRDMLIAAGGVEGTRLPGLSEERRPVIPGGLLVLEAAFEALGVDSMQVAETAMREGILYDLLGRAQDRDPRDASIAAMAQRYGVDTAQSQRVEDTALALFDQVRDDWELADEDRLMLAWAARIHEIGLSIAHSQYHHHSAYVAEHSDIAGFSRQEQQVLAALLRCHRRALSASALKSLPERLEQSTLRNVLLLRLAVLLHRNRTTQSLPEFELRVGAGRIDLALPASWLESRSLTRNDLEAERDHLAAIDLRLNLPDR